MVITAAACEPSYVQEALEHLGPLVRDLNEKAGCVGARYGTVATGMDAGSLALFQSYAGLSDVEKIFDVYAASSDYQKITKSGKTNEQMKGLVPIFERNGAMLMRYGTLITGSNAGKRLAGVTYPSMDAIEKTYDGLRASGDYRKLLNEAHVIRREIVRFAG